jgi:predicted membrane chloride channel (bestrophin family)
MTIYYKDPIATFGKDYVFPLSWTRVFFHWYGSLVQRLLFELLSWIGAAVLVIALKLYVAEWPTPFLNTLAALVSVLSPILTFMLGFYTSTIYSRWWTVRVVMCGTGQIAAYNIALEMTSFVYDDNDPIGAARLKQLIVRWICIPFAMVLRDVFLGGDHAYRTTEAMERIGLITPEERYRLENDVDRAQWTMPVMWAGHLLSRLRDQNHRYGITEFVHLQLVQQLALVRGYFGYLYVPMWVPVPLMYRQLVNATVRIYVICVILLAGNLNLLSATSSSIDIGNYRWLDIIYVLSVFLIYIGWLHVADELANVFRIAPDSLDFDDYLSSQRVDFATMVDDHCIKLPTIESIAEEPLPGEEGFNCFPIMRDHRYEAVPGWQKFQHLRRRPRDVGTSGSRTYDAFEQLRAAELRRQAHKVMASLRGFVHDLRGDSDETDDRRDGFADGTRRKKKPPVRYLGY